MPNVDYACHDCGTVAEKTFKYPYVPPAKIECVKCGALADRVFSAPAVHQTGYKEGDARFNRGRG